MTCSPNLRFKNSDVCISNQVLRRGIRTQVLLRVYCGRKRILFPSVQLLLFMVTHLFAGGLRYHATETERTVGSSPCLWGKWIPEKMPTPTCWPKTKRVTCTKSSVSWNTTITYKLFIIKKEGCVWVFFKTNSLFPVHNVKPECLDAYNKLWWVLSQVTDCPLFLPV